jgi:mono/diheme cytochrome c family protein
MEVLGVRQTWMLSAGLTLAVVGLGGCALLGATVVVSRHVAGRGPYAPQQDWDGTVPRLDLPRTAPSAAATGGISAGEMLYLTGVGHDGRVAYTLGPAWFQRIGGGCVGCHGTDGTARQVTSASGGAIGSGDIRYDSLAGLGTTAESSATVGGWTDEDIVAAIRDGVAPDGSELDPTMPRWAIDDTDMATLLDYLKELSSR